MKPTRIIAGGAGLAALVMAVAVPTMMWSPATGVNTLPTTAADALAHAIRPDPPAAARAPAGSRVRGVSAADIIAAAGDLSDPANRAPIAPLLERLEAAERRGTRVTLAPAR
jgi:hypothetical protein